MKIKRQKVPHGWRGEITNDETKEIFLGNIRKTIGGAKVQVKVAFIAEKQRQIKGKREDIKNILAQIEQIKKL